MNRYTEPPLLPVMQRALRNRSPISTSRAIAHALLAWHAARVAAWNARGIRHNVPMDPNVGVA